TFCLSFIVVLIVVVPPALGSITIGNTLTSESLNLNTSDLGQNLTTPDATEPPTPDATEPTPFVVSGVTFLLQMDQDTTTPTLPTGEVYNDAKDETMTPKEEDNSAQPLSTESNNNGIDFGDDGGDTGG
ncbi:MAG: hypothetical protein M3M88_04895, partial [Thermoproteota archaeon]|nr:hypothetical protein [Thermoproteota archaeon]